MAISEAVADKLQKCADLLTQFIAEETAARAKAGANTKDGLSFENAKSLALTAYQSGVHQAFKIFFDSSYWRKVFPETKDYSKMTKASTERAEQAKEDISLVRAVEDLKRENGPQPKLMHPQQYIRTLKE